MVKLIAENNGRKILLTGVFNGIIGKIKCNILKKVFGNLTYEQTNSSSMYTQYNFEESMRKTE